MRMGDQIVMVGLSNRVIPTAAASRMIAEDCEPNTLYVRDGNKDSDDDHLNE
jgi:hypothetical protein